jgi:hypothetical protein
MQLFCADKQAIPELHRYFLTLIGCSQRQVRESNLVGFFWENAKKQSQKEKVRTP